MWVPLRKYVELLEVGSNFLWKAWTQRSVQLTSWTSICFVSGRHYSSTAIEQLNESPMHHRMHSPCVYIYIYIYIYKYIYIQEMPWSYYRYYVRKSNFSKVKWGLIHNFKFSYIVTHSRAWNRGKEGTFCHPRINCVTPFVN